jgi:trk system potassium uptake protein TrkH
MYLPPIVLAAVDEHWESAVRFCIGALITFTLGVLFSSRREPKGFHREEALAVVALTWLFVGGCGAIPYVLYGLNVVDAFFESISGYTTTGATVLQDFSNYDRPFFLWRSMTQWFGGLGVIALFIVVLPRLGIAGRQLFFAEASSLDSEGLTPQVRKGAQRLWVLYSGLTIALASLLHVVAGFDWFESVTHSLTTMSAGGFSPNGSSIAGYESASAEWILILFMLLSGASYTLQYRVLAERNPRLLRDGEFVLYSGLIFVAGVVVAGILAEGLPTLETLRLALFQTASLMSSTGFASTDYNYWSDSARAMLIVVMLVGGCAGSAAGGPKVVRLILVLKHVAREIRVTLHPRAVLAIRHKGVPVSRDIMRSVFTLVVLFMLGHFLLGTALVVLGADLVVGYSAALACLGNIGPGFDAVGPMGNFAGFDPLSKVLLTLAMWLGRLEIVTVLALLHFDVLRGIRFRGKSQS